MVNIKKAYNLIVIFTLIGMLVCQDSYGLRVPMMDSKRISKVIETQPLEGPFRVKGGRLCYVSEVSDHDEMRKTLDRWFTSGEERDLHKISWEADIKNYPHGLLLKIESEGEILGLSFFHKENGALFSKNGEEVGATYIGEATEVSKEYRKNGLGKILVAKSIEKSLNDPDVKDMVRVTLPTFDTDDWWDQKIGASSTYGYEYWISGRNIPLYRIISRPRAIEILEEVRDSVVDEETSAIEIAKIPVVNNKVFVQPVFEPTHDKVLNYIDGDEYIITCDADDDRTAIAWELSRMGKSYASNEANWLIEAERRGCDWSLLHPRWQIEELSPVFIPGPKPAMTIDNFTPKESSKDRPVLLTICFDYFASLNRTVIYFDGRKTRMGKHYPSRDEIFKEAEDLAMFLRNRNIFPDKIICAESKNYCPEEYIPIIKEAIIKAFGQNSTSERLSEATNAAGKSL